MFDIDLDIGLAELLIACALAIGAVVVWRFLLRH